MSESVSPSPEQTQSQSSPGISGTPTSQSGPVDPTLVPGSLHAGSASSGGQQPTAMLQRTLGQYELVELLGQGGMGSVYKARHKNLDKLVALKLLPSDLMRTEQSVARFKREMKAVGKITHQNIVQAFDAGEIGGTHYLAMELVEGTDLQKLVKDRGTLSVKDACKAIRQSALGLDAAHKVGLVHRDIKPSNLLLAKNGQIKVLDLGLASIGDDGTPHEAITSSGQVLGTPDYMAPEQWEDTHTADLRTDLYAFGCTLFYLLTGRAPYATDEFKSVIKKMTAHVNAPIPDLKALRADVPDGLNVIYQRLMSKRPEERFGSAAELAQALAPFVTSKSVESATVAVDSRRTSPPPSDRSVPQLAGSDERGSVSVTSTGAAASDETPPRRGNRKWLIGVAGAAVLLLFGVIIITIRNKDGTVTEIKVPEGAKVEITNSSTTPESPPSKSIGWHGWPADAPKPAIAPFNADEAKAYQEAWAKYLNVPVEYENSIGMKFRLIPPGEFTMGMTPEEAEAIVALTPDDPYWREQAQSSAPPHRESVIQAYYMGFVEVTQSQYEKIFAANPSCFSAKGAGKDKVTGEDTGQFPVETVSFNEAAEFCIALSKSENSNPHYFFSGDEFVTSIRGDSYRLPTEAEWEHACRAGTTSPWFHGAQENKLGTVAWYGVGAGNGNSADRTHRVGQLQANPFGLHDVHGNVWEMCEDWFDPTSYTHNAEITNRQRTIDVSKGRAVRGGGFLSFPSHCRSDMRHAFLPTARHQENGFRLLTSVTMVRQALKRTGPPIPDAVPSDPLANPASPAIAESVPPNPRNEVSIDFAAERKAAARLLRLAMGKVILGNQRRQEIGELKEPLPTIPICILSVNLQDANLTDEDLGVLAGCTQITQLNLSGNPRITSAGLKSLEGLQSLRSLNLSATAIDSDGLAFIGRQSQLQRLELRDSQIDDTGLDQLAACRELRSIAVGGSRVTAAGLAQIVRACPRLTEISLVGDSGANLPLAPLAGLRYLRAVHCAAKQITPEGIDVLRSLPQFEQLHLNSPTDAAVELVVRLGQQLQRLDCVATNDGDTGLTEAGFQSVGRCRQLVHLKLAGRGAPGDAQLVELARLPDLRSLELQCAEPERRYTTAGLARFRTLRPDVEFRADGRILPALDDWPGKFEGSASIPDWPDLGMNAPAPAVAPFSPDEAQQHQVAWAKHLGKDVEVTNSIGMKFRLIPPGGEVTTNLGTPEQPRLALQRVAQPYYLGTIEVTVGQFKQFVEATGYVTDAERLKSGQNMQGQRDPGVTWKTPGYEISDDLPVNVVSPADAQAFCDWLNDREGEAPAEPERSSNSDPKKDGSAGVSPSRNEARRTLYRLPTELEWGAACHAGSTGVFSFADTAEGLLDYAWTRENTEGKPTQVQPVATRRANPFGLYDVLGNVWEWPVSASGVVRGVIGASVFENASSTVNRFVTGTQWVQPNVGFRVLRQVEPSVAVAPPKFGEQPMLVARNTPLGPQATVTRPTPIPGVRSWTVELPGSIVHSIAYSPNGNMIATAGHDKVIRLQDRDGNLKSILLGQAGFIPGEQLCFSPDGTKLACGDAAPGLDSNSSLRIWDVATETCQAVVPFGNWIEFVTWSPDGKYIAGRSYINGFILEVATGQVQFLPWNLREYSSFAWSADSKTLCVPDQQRVWLFSVATREKLKTLTAPNAKPDALVNVIACSSNGRWIAYSIDRHVHIWDIETDQHQRSIEMSGNVWNLAWHPDAERLAVCFEGEPNLVILNGANGQIESKISLPFGQGFAWSPDRSEFVIHRNGVLEFYECRTGKLLRRGIESAEVPPHNTSFFSVDDKRLLFDDRSFDTETGQFLNRRKWPGELRAIANDERWRAYEKGENEVEIEPKRVDRDPITIQTPGRSDTWRSDVRSERIGGVFDRSVRIWDTRNGMLQGALDHPGRVWGFEWSGDGQQIATIADDKAVRIWDAATHKLAATFNKFPFELTSGMASRVLTWKHDGRNIWVTMGNHAGLLDLSTGRVSQVDNFSNGNAVVGLALAPDGDRLLVNENSGWLLLRNRDGTRLVLGQFPGISPKWHSDSRRILSGGYASNGVIRGYDIATQQQLGSLWPKIRVGDDWFHWLCIGPTGHYRGSHGIEEQIVYVAQLDDGSHVTLAPADFAQRFGWKNDPSKATLLKLDE